MPIERYFEACHTRIRVVTLYLVHRFYQYKCHHHHWVMCRCMGIIHINWSLPGSWLTACIADHTSPGPEVIKLFSYSTQLSRKFILLINVKMPTIVGILTFVSMISTTTERLKARNFFICRYFSFNEQLKFCAQLS